MFGLTVGDEWLVSSTIAGPVLAVQAQKWIERATNNRRQKLGIFYTLMATRATRVAPDHVQALNRIDLEFSGFRIFGYLFRQNPKERAVTEAWKSYHDLLSIDLKGKSQDEIRAWNKDCDWLFIDLLYFMSNSLGYFYDRVHLKRGTYYPTAHSEIENTQKGIQDNLLRILSGNSALQMNIVGFPFSQAAVDAQIELQKSIVSAITPEGEIRVTAARPLPP